MDGESRRAFWAKHIEVFVASGQSRRAYCAAHGLSRSTLDYWRRRLRPGADHSRLRSSDEAAVPAFVAVRVAPQPLSEAATLTLRWPSGLQLTLPREVDAAWLASVLSGLGG